MTKINLIKGDALEELKKLKTNSFDLIITDPPYFLGFSSSVKEGGRQDWGSHTLLKPMFDFLFEQFTRILKEDGRLFMFTDWRTYPSLSLSASKFIKIANLIVWDFMWIKAGNQFRFTHEFILHGIMPNTNKPKDRSISDVWRIKPVNYTVKRNHPSEKPVELINFMLKNTALEGFKVLDPFMGSGTTGVACKQNGLSFTGIEIDHKYFSVALQRIEEAQENLFSLDAKEESGLEQFLN